MASLKKTSALAFLFILDCFCVFLTNMQCDVSRADLLFYISKTGEVRRSPPTIAQVSVINLSYHLYRHEQVTS